MITPTVGRIVWFYPGPGARSRMNVLGNQPMRADIIYVIDDHTVNLSVTDHSGVEYPFDKVPLVQEGETPPERRSYCEWMPCQLAVAKGKILPAVHATGSPTIATSGTEVDSH